MKKGIQLIVQFFSCHNIQDMRILPAKGADFLDTGTHIVMGVALSGLALADPVVSAETRTMSAVFTGVIVGSLIPDIDTVLKLRNNAVYIRHHRGITHSIPAVLFGHLFITILLSFFLS